MTDSNEPVVEFAHASKDQLKTIIEAFAQITWPAPAEAADRLVAQLGWDRRNLRVARTNLPVEKNAATIGLADGVEMLDVFRDLEFFVTDAVNGPGAERVLEMYRTMVRWVSEIAGPAVASREPSPHPDASPDFPTTWWELPGGGGVRLFFIDDVVTMELTSKKTTDRYRFEREHPEYAEL